MVIGRFPLLILWFLAAGLLANQSVRGEDLRPGLQGSITTNQVTLLITNLTPTLRHEVQRTQDLENPEWELVSEFFPSSSEFTWMEPTPFTGTASYYRVVTYLPADPYTTYFLRNASVADVTVNRFEPATKTYFTNYLNEVETSGAIAMDPPLSLQNCVSPQSCTSISLSPEESQRILAAKAAHAIWLDHNELVTWRLRSYSAEDLRRLLHEDHLFSGSSLYSFYRVVDHSPSEVYRYATEQGLIYPTQLQTVHAAFADFRNDFRHSNTSDINRNTAYTVREALTTYADWQRRVSRGGCHAMTRISVAVLRSLNIPGEEVRNTSSQVWFGNGHSSAVWPCINRALPHGDNVYNALLLATPIEQFLTPITFFDENADPCGTDRFCIARRHSALNAIQFPASYLTSRCCAPENYGYTNCLEAITRNLGQPLPLTQSELTNAVPWLESFCP